LELRPRIQEGGAACYYESRTEETIMDIPVLIQPVPGKGFVATAPAFGWSAEGRTEDEALQEIRKKVADATAGARVAVVAVPNGTPTTTPGPTATAGAKDTVFNPPAPGENPWLRLAGTLDPNDPTVQEWRKAVEEYRRQVDNDPDAY
jgi:hypothetical protein